MAIQRKMKKAKRGFKSGSRLSRSLESGNTGMDFPIDVLVKIFALLPLNTICQIRCVCTCWNFIITARMLRESQSFSTIPSQVPRYFLRADNGYLTYNQASHQWKFLPLSFLFPDCIPAHNVTVFASAGGMLLLQHHSRSCPPILTLFNPISKSRKTLRPMPEPSLERFYSFSLLEDENSKVAKVFAFSNFQSEKDLSETMGTYDLSTDSWTMTQIRSGSPSKKYWCRDLLFCRHSLYCWVETLVMANAREQLAVNYLFRVENGEWHRIHTRNMMPAVISGCLFEHKGKLMLVGGYFHSLNDFRICIWKLDASQLQWDEFARLPADILKRIIRVRSLHGLVFRAKAGYIFFGFAHTRSRMVIFDILGFSWRLLPPIPAPYANYLVESAGTSAHDRFLFEPRLT